MAPEARADKKKAMDNWKKGNTSYTLGKFGDAIKHFESAYLEHPAPAFLFNIAQCHRQLRNCERSGFFYRRYLSLKPDADNRAEVEAYIAAARKQCAASGGPKTTKPGGGTKTTKTGGGTKTTKTGGGTKTTKTGGDGRVAMTGGGGGGDSSAVVGGGDTAGTISDGVDDDAPFLTSVFELGPSFISMGDLEVPTQFTIRIGVGYPMDFGAIAIEPGLTFTVTPIKYEDGSNGTASLTSLLVNVPVYYAINTKLRARAELGLGGLFFSGLQEGNPFTEGGKRTTGALSMFNIRFALGVDYAITDKLIASATPISIAQSPAKEGLHESIDSIVRFEVLGGIGYRF